MSLERWDVPPGWEWRTIGDLGEVHGGGTPPARDPSNFDDSSGFGWITPSDMSAGGAYVVRGRRSLSAQGLKKSGARLLPTGTVVFSSRAPIGYCAVAAGPLSTSQGCRNIVLRDGHVPEYLMHYLRHSKDYATAQASGTTFLEISAAKLRSLAVPVPPVADQAAIALALAHLLRRVGHAREALRSVPELIERQTGAILAAAYDGLFTPSTSRPSGLPPPAARTRLAELLSSPIRNGLSIRGHDVPPGVRALRLSALRSRRVDLDDVRYLFVDAVRASRFALADGDVLVARGSGTRSLVGRAALVEGLAETTIFPDTAFRLQVNHATTSPSWLSHLLNAPQVRRGVRESARTTAGIWKIRQGDIADLRIPVPPLDEQRATAMRVDAALARVDALHEDCRGCLEMIGTLENWILELAFRGRLLEADTHQLLDFTLDELREQAATALRPETSPKESREAPARMSRVTKSRFDPEVEGKPYLAGRIADRAGIALSAKRLFEASELSIIDFYKQLLWEIDHGFVVDDGDGFKACK